MLNIPETQENRNIMEIFEYGNDHHLKIINIILYSNQYHLSFICRYIVGDVIF